MMVGKVAISIYSIDPYSRIDELNCTMHMHVITLIRLVLNKSRFGSWYC